MWTIKRTIDLKYPERVPAKAAPIPLMYPGDAEGHTIQLTVLDNGATAALSGTAYGFFTRADGQTVVVAGTIAANVISVQMSYDCYAVRGGLRAVIRMGNPIVDPGDPCTSLLELDFYVREGFGSTYTPSGTFPTLDAINTRVTTLEGLGLTSDGTTLTSAQPLDASAGAAVTGGTLAVTGGATNLVDENGDKIINTAYDLNAEQLTGYTWTDGSPIYRSTFVKGSVTTTATWVTIGTISGMDKVVDIRGVFERTAVGDYAPLIYFSAMNNANANSGAVVTVMNTGVVRIYVGTGCGNISNIRVTVEYTKA